MTGSLYDSTLPRLSGGDLRLTDHVGQRMLLVNTASGCGFTPHYAGLERPWRAYRHGAFVVLG